MHEHIISSGGSGLSLAYFGWSSFRLDGLSCGSLLIDPVWSVLLNESFGKKKDFEGASAILISHGHHEHLRDTGALLRDNPVPTAGPDTCMKYLNKRKKVPSKILVEITMIRERS